MESGASVVAPPAAAAAAAARGVSRSSLPLLLIVVAATARCASSFSPLPASAVVDRRCGSPPTTTTTTTLRMAEGGGGGGVSMPGMPGEKMSKEEDDEVQWNLFKRHHAKGSWRGTWTSYDYMGDVVDSTIASVNLNLDDEAKSAEHSHTFVTSSKVSDCQTCFDSTETKTLPVATYTPGDLRKARYASVASVTGPSLLRSGAMSTELALTHGDGRVRVTFQHAPVWEKGIEPGSCPPQGLKLFRTTVSREALRPGPPTAESEASNPPPRGDPKFFRPIPPFFWHKKWAGTSWTWGPSTGDRGWRIEEMDEMDAWHGRPTGDHMGVWSMRLPGGILVQCPRVFTGGEAGLCRLAWLPEDDAPPGTAEDGDPARLLRAEASVLALEPVIDEEEDLLLGFYPPSLGSLRCDVLRKVGELEDASMLKKLMEMDKDDAVAPVKEAAPQVPQPPPQPSAPAPAAAKGSAPSSEGVTKKEGGDKGEEPDSGLDAIRRSLKF